MLWLPRSCSTWSGCAPTSQSLCCSRFLNACVAFCTLCAGPEVARDLEDSGESGRPACTRAHAGEWRQVEARKLAECWAKMSKTDSSRASVVCSVGCLALWGVGVGVQGYQMCLISLHIAPNRYSTQDKLRAQPDFRAKYGCDADGVRTSMSPSDVASKGGVYNASTRAADASSLVATTLSEVFATCLRAPLSRRRVETDVRVESSRPCFATLTHPSGFRKTRPATWGGRDGLPSRNSLLDSEARLYIHDLLGNFVQLRVGRGLSRRPKLQVDLRAITAVDAQRVANRALGREELSGDDQSGQARGCNRSLRECVTSLDLALSQTMRPTTYEQAQQLCESITMTSAYIILVGQSIGNMRKLVQHHHRHNRQHNHNHQASLLRLSTTCSSRGPQLRALIWLASYLLHQCTATALSTPDSSAPARSILHKRAKEPPLNCTSASDTACIHTISESSAPTPPSPSPPPASPPPLPPRPRRRALERETRGAKRLYIQRV